MSLRVGVLYRPVALVHIGEFGEQPPFTWVAPVSLQRARPADACTTIAHPEPVHGAVLLADRGNCTFVEKARLAADAGAAGLIVINNGSDCLVMDSGATKEALSSLKGLFVASATNETGADLVRWVGAEVTYAGIKAHILDPASALLLVLALGVLTIAALWSGKSFEDHLKREQQHRRGTEPGAQHLSTAEVDGVLQDQIKISVPVVAVFVAIASIMMFALFFVLNKYVFYLFLVIFSYSSFTATVLCTRAALRAVSRQSTIRVFAISRFRLEASRGDLAAVIFAAVLVLIWLFNRHASWAWTPLDILGCFFMTMILQVVVLPDGRVATFFLCALVAYDIFMVFITPLFMPHGKSVMVHVARGGSAHEMMPMLLYAPRMLPPIKGAMMLGYGDVVVPGLLIAMLRRFDCGLGRTLYQGYFLPSMVAYTVGLILTDLALEFRIFGSQGQPALMYLVPCTLGCTWLLAACRGDVLALWHGKVEDWKDHASGSDDQDSERQVVDVGGGAEQRSGYTAADAQGVLVGALVPSTDERQRLL